MATAQDKKYYIYSSKAGKEPSENARVLSTDAESRSVDTFLSLLPDEGLVLGDKPTGTSATLDVSDRWATWMTNWDPDSQLSVSFDNPTDFNIKGFTLRLNAPWNLTFSSGADALVFAFGRQPVAGSGPVMGLDTSGTLVPSPGISKNGTPLFFGLDPQATPSEVKTTVGEIFSFADLRALGEKLPISGLNLLSATLKARDAAGKRNALWFSPEKHLKTIMRLQFQLDSANVLEKALAAKLPGLELHGVDVVCTRKMVLVETNLGATAVPRGHVTFEIACSLKHRSWDRVGMLLELQVGFSFITCVFKVDSGNGLAAIIDWLADMLPKTSRLGSVEKILNTDNIFEDHIFLRSFKVGFHIVDSSSQLASVSLDIEVSSGTLGQSLAAGEDKRAVFLMTYGWAVTEIGPMESFSGNFWNKSEKIRRILSPEYKPVSDLQPITRNPATDLEVAALIPGHTIRNLPESVPCLIKCAEIYPDTTGFVVKTRVKPKRTVSENTESTLLDPFRSTMNLAASYKWGKRSHSRMVLGLQSTIQISNATDAMSAIIKGSVEYNPNTKMWQVMDVSTQDFDAMALAKFLSWDLARDAERDMNSLLTKALSEIYSLHIKTEEEQYSDKEGSVAFNVDRCKGSR